MASSSGTSQEQRRWVVVGIALHEVLIPCLRDKIKSEMTPFYQHTVRNFGLDKQTFGTHCKTFPTTFKTYPTTCKTYPTTAVHLNYGSINSNATRHGNKAHCYDYCVKDEVSLAKLFMKPFMAQFNAFDQSFDSSAALSVLCGALPFTSVQKLAGDVRFNVRNKWAHCNFADWTEKHYDTCFDLMEALVKNLGVLPIDETRVLGTLKLWRNHGLEICLGTPLDNTLLKTFHKEVQQLSADLLDCKVQSAKITVTLNQFKTELDRAVALKDDQDMARDEMKETSQEVQILCKALEDKSISMRKDLDSVIATVNRMPTSEDDFKQVVFDAPDQNKFFAGRASEIKSLERCLPLDKSKQVRMAAICGLGGCGKTTLAIQFAWKYKNEYEGGVFWISMEDDKKFENSVTDLALRLKIYANSFDVTLSKFLTWISRQEKTWLLVLDDVDQFNLSEGMHKVLFGRWKRQASGHVLLTTRREPKEVSESLTLEPSCCLQVSVFPEDDAKCFLVARSGINNAAEEEAALDELVRELGSLPLALEQAGAHIKALECSVSSYLEEYKSQRMKLLSQRMAKPSWEYESPARRAVHTTWLLNFEYVKRSNYGDVASRFVQAAAFLAPNEIQEELINSQLLSADGQSIQSRNLPLMKECVIETLTKFSLFQRKRSSTLWLHHLVQEVIRSRLTVDETSSSLISAVKIVDQAFRNCPSPERIPKDVGTSVREQPSAHVANRSLFYLWSKLTTHSSELQYHLKLFLDKNNIGREDKAVILSQEASHVVYQNAIHLSVHGHQKDAKESERLAIQILDSCPSDDEISKDFKDLLPHTLPFPQKLQKTVLYSCHPPIENQAIVSGKEMHPESASTDDIRLRGNDLFKAGRFREAVEAYTEALEATKDAKHQDPRLFHNRATAHLKLRNFEKCLQDSQEYIKLMPNCWKGYSRRALALTGLGMRSSALCSAAIAYHHDKNSCCDYEAFRTEFKDLDSKLEVVESSEQLMRSLERNKNENLPRKVLLLANTHYEMGDAADPDCFFTSMASLGDKADLILNCGELSIIKDCVFQNIKFSGKCAIFIPADGNAEFYKCTFRNSVLDCPVMAIEGKARLFECEIRNSEGSGLGIWGPFASVELIKCQISGNGRMNNPNTYGIRAFDRGQLLVNKCHVYGNTRGIWLDEGPREGVPARGVTITDSEIYDNKYEGVVVGGVPGSAVCPFGVILRNKIYHNGTFGFRATLCIDDVLLEGNMVFKNLWWGIFVHNNSGGLYKNNEIYSNKMGGVMIGKRSPGKTPCVLENNYIHDNCGPAFREGLRPNEGDSFPREFKVFFEKALQERVLGQGMATDVTVPNMTSAEIKSNQCLRNDLGQTNLKGATGNTYCLFCFRHDVELKTCKRCMTARYCGKECQKQHWKKHKNSCKAMGERNLLEVSLPTIPTARLCGAAIPTHPYTHKGQPQLREFHSLHFPISVWAP
ncbi:uncharacterized protein [Montipora foliosa]|uniref:uncharacterized protein isoform X2 n=1 Tax=Montipora foliosa TaxID=591990 RepID=UPI0035F17571